MRYRNPMLCTIGALAQYLFQHQYISSELAPSFQQKQDQYQLKVLIGASPIEELVYIMQYNSYFNALYRASVSIESITYITRKKGAQEAERLGVLDLQVSQILCIYCLPISIASQLTNVLYISLNALGTRTLVPFQLPTSYTYQLSSFNKQLAS